MLGGVAEIRLRSIAALVRRPARALALGVTLAAGAALGVAAEALAIGPPQLAYRSGNLRIAGSALRRALLADPDNADLHARLGITYAKAGDYADALPHFTFALGSGDYEAEGWGPHADALRGVGRGYEAASLRLERMLILPGDRKRLTACIDATDDLLAAGDGEGAWAMAELCVSEFPSANLAFTKLADVLLALDEQDELDVVMALMESQPAQSMPSRRLRAHVAAHDGDPYRAYKMLMSLPGNNRSQPEVLADIAALQLEMEEPDAALWTLTRPMVKARNHPAVMAGRVEALGDLNRFDERDEVCALASARFPEHPAVREATQGLDCAASAP